MPPLRDGISFFSEASHSSLPPAAAATGRTSGGGKTAVHESTPRMHESSATIREFRDSFVDGHRPRHQPRQQHRVSDGGKTAVHESTPRMHESSATIARIRASFVDGPPPPPPAAAATGRASGGGKTAVQRTRRRMHESSATIRVFSVIRFVDGHLPPATSRGNNRSRVRRRAPE